MEKPFYVVSKIITVAKFAGHGKMHISAKKWCQNSKVFYGTCINRGHLRRKPSELLLGAFFVKNFSLKPWSTFGIFPRYLS
jgi:hypothetical protein